LEPELDGPELDAIDRVHDVLSSEDAILPSSGFLLAVMERVQQEAAAPEPIPFPWKRALPGLVLLLGALGWLGAGFMRDGIPALRQAMMAPHHTVGMTHLPAAASWIVLTLALTLGSLLLARRLVGPSRLF
jgi:hypothetical protein